MDPFSLLGQFLSKAKGQLGDTLGQFVPQANQVSPTAQNKVKGNPSQMKLTVGSSAQPASSTPAPSAPVQIQPTLTQQATGGNLPALRGFQGQPGMSGDQLRALIAQHRGGDTPILSQLGTLIQAGNQLPENIDPMLPIILAIRETQGGKFNKGQNNPYNLRGEQGGQSSKFIDYPNIETASLGGYNPMGDTQSQGLVGLIGKNDLYSKFRQTGRLQDLFEKYSPPTDSNGNLDEQAHNYKWIRNQILGLSQE